MEPGPLAISTRAVAVQTAVALLSPLLVAIIPIYGGASITVREAISTYGLGGGVVSGDEERGMRVARQIRAGAISVNDGMSISGDLPFGGFKGSGMGREWGREGIEEFLDLKAIAVGVS